jgi:hypothetical protein
VLRVANLLDGRQDLVPDLSILPGEVEHGDGDCGRSGGNGAFSVGGGTSHGREILAFASQLATWRN